MKNKLLISIVLFIWIGCGEPSQPEEVPKFAKFKETQSERYVDIKLKTDELLDSNKLIKVTQSIRPLYLNEQKVVVWFYLENDTLSPYANVLYPSAQYVRDEIQSTDVNGSKYKIQIVK